MQFKNIPDNILMFLFLSVMVLLSVSGCQQSAKQEQQGSDIDVITDSAESTDRRSIMETNTSVSWDNEKENDAEIISKQLNIKITESLQDSMTRLYGKGCSHIRSSIFIKEQSGWIYFSVIDNNGSVFYIDTNKNGNFGTVLTEEGYNNAETLSACLGIDMRRELLYSAETLEKYQCGLIDSVDNIIHKKAYRFTITNNQGKRYVIRMSQEGSISEIESANGKIIYAMYE